MKRFAVIAVLVLAFVTISFAEVKQEAQKFKVSYTITYKSINLEEAAKIETAIKKEFKDACVVNINIQQDDRVTFSSGFGVVPDSH